MFARSFSCLCLAALTCVDLVTAQNCKNWVPIPEANYSRIYVAINSPEANVIRPLGFKTASLEFDGETPCFYVFPTGGNNRHIEVKWELDLPGTLWVKNNIQMDPQCNSGENNQLCSTVPGGVTNVTYTFLCQGSNCESGVKQFWFRFVVEDPNSNGEYDENWCATRSSDYPSSLAPIPSVTAPVSTTTTGGAASSVAEWRFSFILVLLAFAVL